MSPAVHFADGGEMEKCGEITVGGGWPVPNYRCKKCGKELNATDYEDWGVIPFGWIENKDPDSSIEGYWKCPECSLWTPYPGKHHRCDEKEMKQKHSPEPWETDDYRTIDDANEELVISLQEPGWSIENIDRLIKCVNALAGIPDEEIENVVKAGLLDIANTLTDTNEFLPEWLRKRMEKQ